MKTTILIEVTHSKPINNLADLIANRSWTLDGVENAEALLFRSPVVLKPSLHVELQSYVWKEVDGVDA